MGTNTKRTGDLYLGQTSTYGGGMIYQGDVNTGQTLISNSYRDYVTFYRMNDGTRSGVFGYMYDLMMFGWER